MSGFSTIRVDKSLPVARLTLARPERLNSFSKEMVDELSRALADLAATPGIRCLILLGEGRGFSAGQDLEERRIVAEGGSIDLQETLTSGLNRIIAALSDLPFPTVASVGGVAAGAGASLALAADLCIAAEDAKFLMSFSNVGLGPDAGLSWVLPRLVGRAEAMGRLMLGTGWSGAEAAAAGLILRAVPAANLAAETEALASTLAARPTQALVAARRLLNAAGGAGLREQLATEALSQKALGESDDYRAAVTAFQSKRKPSFTGR